MPQNGARYWGKAETMAMQQRDKLIEEIRRIEGLMAYAEAHELWEQLEELKTRLKAVIDRLP